MTEHISRFRESFSVFESHDKNSLDLILDKMTKECELSANLPLLLAAMSFESRVSYNDPNYKRGKLSSLPFIMTTSEMVSGIDYEGILGSQREEITIIVHGQCMINYDSTRDSIQKKSFDVRCNEDDFSNLMQGKLPTGEAIDLYTIEDIRDSRILDPFGRYAVWGPYKLFQEGIWGNNNYEQFINNPVTLACAGTTEYLEKIFYGHNLRGIVQVTRPQMMDKYPTAVILGVSNLSPFRISSCSIVNIARYLGIKKKN